jgi:outer membrane lipopolysaccharide assembly protein LptE/RlpB
MKSKLLLLVCMTTLLCGCGPRLSDQRDLTLEIGQIRAIPIDPISREQKIKVSASSPDAPIDVHVYLQENEAAIVRMITLGKPPENLLASQSEAEQVLLEATVPANKEAIVRLQPSGRKAAQVHLEITN